MTKKEIVLDFMDNGEAIEVDQDKFGLGLRHITSNAKLYNGSFNITRVGNQNLQRLLLLKSYILGVDK